MIDWSTVRYFTSEEMACSCCGVERMDGDFMHALDDVRRDLNKPLLVSSGYRCAAHNAAVSTTGPHGPHTTGRAVDVLVYGKDAYEVLSLALVHRFTGIGVSQRGPHGSRFLHLDMVDEPGRPWIWSY